MTGVRFAKETPQSPRKTFVSHATYWFGNGSSRLYFARTALICSGVPSAPNMIVAVSPGKSRTIRKMTIVSTKITARAERTFPRMNVFIECPWLHRPSRCERAILLFGNLHTIVNDGL